MWVQIRHCLRNNKNECNHKMFIAVGKSVHMKAVLRSTAIVSFSYELSRWNISLQLPCAPTVTGCRVLLLSVICLNKFVVFFIYCSWQKLDILTTSLAGLILLCKLDFFFFLTDDMLLVMLPCKLGLNKNIDNYTQSSKSGFSFLLSCSTKVMRESEEKDWRFV